MAHERLLANQRRLRHRPRIVRYAAAALFVVLAILARRLLAPVLSDRQPFPTFYVSLTAAAWWGGWGRRCSPWSSATSPRTGSSSPRTTPSPP